MQPRSHSSVFTKSVSLDAEQLGLCKMTYRLIRLSIHVVTHDKIKELHACIVVYRPYMYSMLAIFVRDFKEFMFKYACVIKQFE